MHFHKYPCPRAQGLNFKYVVKHLSISKFRRIDLAWFLTTTASHIPPPPPPFFSVFHLFLWHCSLRCRLIFPLRKQSPTCMWKPCKLRTLRICPTINAPIKRLKAEDLRCSRGSQGGVSGGLNGHWENRSWLPMIGAWAQSAPAECVWTRTGPRQEKDRIHTHRYLLAIFLLIHGQTNIQTRPAQISDSANVMRKMAHTGSISNPSTAIKWHAHTHT